MNWFSLISNLVSRVPIERVLFPPRDNTKALEEFAATMAAPVAQNKAPSEQKATPTTTTQEPETTPRQVTVATACVACALGHFSTSAGLLNEAVRFEKEGITSNEILDRIGKVLEEQNALERVDLTPEKIRGTPEWERELAEEALQQSRSLRHRLETLTTIKELKEAAADTEGYYRNLNRRWWKLRLTQTGKTEPELTLEDAKKMAAEEAAKQVEKAWQSAPEPSQDTMFFNVPEAREYLVKTGLVYTLRPKMRKTGKDTAFYSTGPRALYEKEKIGPIWVDFIKEVKEPGEVQEYVSDSGFGNVEDWWEAADGSRFLFKVTLKEA